MTSSTGNAAATATPIKVGLICTCSGALGATIEPGETVYKAWVDSVNAAGGIDGHPIDLTVKDDVGVPGTSITDFQALASDHVDAVVDSTVADAGWANTAAASNIPIVGLLPYSPSFYTSPDFYAEGTTIDAGNLAAVITAKAAGAKNFGDLYCAEAAACQQGISIFRTDAKQVGIPLTFTASISGTAPNYTAQCVAAQQAHLQAMFIGSSTPTEPVNIGTDCARQGYYPTYILQGGALFQDDLTAPGLEKDLWAPYNDTPWWVNSPGVQAMNAAVDKYDPGLRQNPRTWGESNVMAWVSGLLLEAGIKAGGLTASATPSAAEVVQGLESLKGDTLGGMAPPLTFTAGKPHPVDCWYTTKLKSGVPSLVDGTTATCESSPS